MEKRLVILEKNGKINTQNQISLFNNQFIKSNIINEKEEKIILNWIPKRLMSTELIFDTSRDGDTIDAFKNKCEGQCPRTSIGGGARWIQVPAISGNAGDNGRGRSEAKRNGVPRECIPSSDSLPR